MDKTPDIKSYLSGKASQSTTEIPCVFCKKISENKLTIINDKSDILGALAVLGVQYENVPGLLDQACYQCVYRINLIIDFRRLIERNLNKARANYFYINGNHEMSKKYLVASSGHIPTTLPTKEQLELLIASIQSETDADNNTADYLFDCFNDPARYSLQRNNTSMPSPSKLLTPMYETSESVMCTESGGQINVETKYTNYNNLSDRQCNYKCQFCTKIYKRLYNLQRHERKHRSQNQRRDSVRTGRTDRTHQCTHCEEVFDKRLQLSKHEQIHRNRTKCSYCTEEFYLLFDLELHEAKCIGEKFAKEETGSVKSRYYTRSRSMSRHRHQNFTIDDDDDDEDDDDETDTCPVLHEELMQNVDDWVGRVDRNYSEIDDNNDDNNDDNDDDDWDDNVSVYSSATTLFTRNKREDPKESPTVCVLERKNYSDSHRMPAKRSRLMSISSNISRGTRAAAKRKKCYDRLEEAIRSQYDENIQVQYHLDHRTATFIKEEITDSEEVLVYKCFMCLEEFPRLSALMAHEIQGHNLIMLYSCLECKYNFTRRVFHARHELRHTDRLCKCFLCYDEFLSQSELDFHLKMHSVRSYPCSCCYQSFLTEQRLAQHMLGMDHLVNEKLKIEYIKLFDEQTEDEVIDEEGDDDDNIPPFRQFDIYVPRLIFRPKYKWAWWILAPHYEPPITPRMEFVPLFT